MSRKGGGLPDIEDATFLACLDPLAETLAAGAPRNEVVSAAAAQRLAAQPLPFPPRPQVNRATDAPRNGATPPEPSGDVAALPSLAAWRSQADEEFAELRAVDRLLAVSEAELAAAWQAHPRQILGFLERLSCMQQRRAAQDQAMATVMTRIHMTMLRAAAERPPQPPAPDPGNGRHWFDRRA